MLNVRRSRSANAEPHLRNVFNSIQTVSPYDVCQAFAYFDRESNKSDIISKVLVRCMFQYRKRCSSDFDKLEMLSKPAEELYYQFRQASTFQQIVDAFDLVNPRGPDPELKALLSRFDRDDGRNVSEEKVEARASRKELCAIQEHFETILTHIFAAEQPNAEVSNELRSVMADNSIQATSNIMTAVFDAVRKQITPVNVANLVLWTLELMKPGEVPQMNPDRALVLLGAPPRQQSSLSSPLDSPVADEQ